MAWLACDKGGAEVIFEAKPIRCSEEFISAWLPDLVLDRHVILPKGSIKKLIGRELTWNDEPVEIKEE